MVKVKYFKDTKIKVRELGPQDLKKAREFANYINELIEEDAKILLKNRKSFKDEKEWLEDQLKKTKKRKGVMLLAFDEDKIVGISEANLEKERSDHVASFGISVRKEYRGIGLGEFLMREVLDLAKEKLKPKLFRLSVFANNEVAQNLYQKLGFVKVATIPKQLQYKGKLVDEVIMIKEA